MRSCKAGRHSQKRHAAPRHDSVLKRAAHGGRGALGRFFARLDLTFVDAANAQRRRSAYQLAQPLLQLAALNDVHCLVVCSTQSGQVAAQVTRVAPTTDDAKVLGFGPNPPGLAEVFGTETGRGCRPLPA